MERARFVPPDTVQRLGLADYPPTLPQGRNETDAATVLELVEATDAKPASIPPGTRT